MQKHTPESKQARASEQLVVVSRDFPDLYVRLTKALADRLDYRVVFDRRQGARSMNRELHPTAKN